MQAVFTETEGGQTTEYIFSREQTHRSNPAGSTGKLSRWQKWPLVVSAWWICTGSISKQSLLEAQRSVTFRCLWRRGVNGSPPKSFRAYRQLQVVEKNWSNWEAMRQQQPGRQILRFQLEEIAQANLSAAEEEELQVPASPPFSCQAAPGKYSPRLCPLAADGHDGAVLDRLVMLKRAGDCLCP